MRSFVIAAVLLWSGFSSAAVQDPKAVVEEIFAKAADDAVVSDISRQSTINAMVDFDALARGALGKLSGKTSPKDFAWFKETLQSIITLTVYPNAPDFLKGVKISYDQVLLNNDTATVSSTVQKKADLTEVSYILHKGKDGAWRVVDIALDGNSWTESINEQVEEKVRKSGWTGLKTAMEKRLSELKKPKTEPKDEPKQEVR